jgi:hypothetical protein
VGKTNEAAESRPHRQVKISRPIPEKPISEAMQQGKEPLRSFGDLMQFFKKGPSTGETSESQTPIPPPPAASDTASEPPADSAPKGVDSQATGDDDVGV